MEIPFSKLTLPNGLDVIVHEDHDCPIVCVNLWYHVGSKNERPGRTGLAHLFEHLMFEGSQHHDHGYFEALQAAGASLNGSTNTDRTNYWEVVPNNALELAVWLESDRMGYLLPALTPQKFENQRDVVLNERRQNYENRPYGFASMAMMAAMHPPDHPYHWLTIGDAGDLRAATLEDAREFFQRFYHPANATLAIAGDVETARAFDLARTYFDEIPAGPAPSPLDVDAPAAPSAEIRLMLEDRIELPRLYLGWLTPRLLTGEDAALDLFAELLGNEKTSRLYRRLVHDLRIATQVAASQGSRELSSLFQVIATAAPGHSLAELEVAISDEIEQLRADGPREDELTRAVVGAEASFVYRLQAVGGFGGKADQLNAYNLHVGDPGYVAQDLARYTTATSVQIRDIARGVLGLSQRIAVSVVPHGQRHLALPASDVVVMA